MLVEQNSFTQLSILLLLANVILTATVGTQDRGIIIITILIIT